MTLDFIKSKVMQNTMYLIFDQIFNLVLSFIFWRLAVFYYEPNIIGYASSFLSIALWLSIVSRLGIDDTVRRFAPEISIDHQKRLIKTSINFVFIISMIISVIGIFLTFFFFSETDYYFILALILVLLVIGLSITPILDSVFIAKEKVNLIVIKSILSSTLRILLLVAFPRLLLVGLLLSSTFPYYFIFLLIYLTLKYQKLEYSFEIDLNLIKQIAKYSLGIFFSSLIYYFPSAIFPLIILEMVSPEESAYFSIAWQLSRIIYIVPVAISYVFVVEGSKNFKKGDKSTISKAFILGVFLLVPFYLFFSYLGSSFLEFFGDNYYRMGLFSFKLLIFTVFPSFVHYIYSIYCQINQNIASLLLINSLLSFSTLMAIFLFIEEYGAISISVAWFGSNLLISLIIISGLIFKIIRKSSQTVVVLNDS